MGRSGSGGRGRQDAERNRDVLVDAAVAQLTRGEIGMRNVARAGGLSHSTLYRHFTDAAALRDAALERIAAELADEIDVAFGDHVAPLALLRRVTAALAETGARYQAATLDQHGAGLDPVVDRVAQLAGRFTMLAGLEPAPPARVARSAATHFARAALRAGARKGDGSVAAVELLHTLTEPLDQGLVVLDGRGRLISLNEAAAAALSVDASLRGRRVTAPAAPTAYEDGAPAPAAAYPLARAVATGEPQAPAIRGHGDAESRRWFAVSAFPLRVDPTERPYAIAGVLSDVTELKRSELEKLPAPGTLGRDRPVPIDVVRVLDEVPAHLLPEQLVAEARRLVGVPVGLYVIDIDGTRLLRLAGAEDFPEQIKAPLALGPELAPASVPSIRSHLEEELPGVVMAPMWLRGRAVGVLLALGGGGDALSEIARLGAPAMELANGYTDVFDATRRRKEINPAAEIQQSLLAPRIARLGAGEVAAGMLPAYDVGGDWFDYVENRDGAWIGIADAAGRGPRAAALGSIGLAALRAARRNDASLEDAMQTMHDTLCSAGAEEFYLTAVIARWSAPHSVFSWINAGHPRPLLLRADGDVEELRGDPGLPLGLGDGKRTFRRSFRRVEPDDRVVLYTDGISQRITRGGFFGIDGIAEAARSASDRSAPAIARAVQEAVANASRRRLRDDAAVLVLAPTRSAG